MALDKAGVDQSLQVLQTAPLGWADCDRVRRYSLIRRDLAEQVRGQRRDPAGRVLAGPGQCCAK
ncbi:hypothetical protein [Mycobacterium palustre]|nr:hypothetical protein [Mycobacterium palustre]MCV7100160.1 hypothetical protein [Mycobacterium palustre]